MTEFTGPESQPIPLRSELEAILPEVARLALLAELRTGSVCTGFGITDTDGLFTASTRRLWRETIPDGDYDTFTTDLTALNQAITERGGAAAVRKSYLEQQERPN